MRRVILLVGIVLLVFIVGLGYQALHNSSAVDKSNPLVDARIEFENALLDRHITHVLPETVFWVSGEPPNYTVLRVEGLVVENGTYLAVFYPREGRLTLIPANKSTVNEYLRFFDEHGGRVLDCKSMTKSTIRTSFGENVTVRELNGMCVVPAIVETGKE
ncbi:hypothetical protein [Thermococcus sp.]|nr:hypothetical protein [Thermococcus sp.]